MPRFNIIWLFLFITAAVFSLLYIWFTLFPGPINPTASYFFDPQMIEDGRQYQRGQGLLFMAGFLLQAAALTWLVFGGKAAALSRWAQHFTGSRAGGLLLFILILWLMLKLISLPLDLYSSYFWQHRWGFSNQSLPAWWVDFAKASLLEFIILGLGVLLIYWIFSRLPGVWWLAGAVIFALWLVVQSYLWPLLVSPLFNRFEAARDPAVVSMVSTLSHRAGLPVDQVLVMDASRRTKKANAYFTGLGGTRRIVLYDNLLKDYSPAEVEAVVAHEMAHWSQGHIVKGLTLGILGSFFMWGLLRVALGAFRPGAYGFPPHMLVVILLFFMLASFVASPLQSHISRGMEKEADRVAVNLTGSADAAVSLQVRLAAKNLSDVSPPGFIKWFSYSHPPALERIELIRQSPGE